jgi:hypothetical protein
MTVFLVFILILTRNLVSLEVSFNRHGTTAHDEMTGMDITQDMTIGGNISFIPALTAPGSPIGRYRQSVSAEDDVIPASAIPHASHLPSRPVSPEEQASQDDPANATTHDDDIDASQELFEDEVVADAAVRSAVVSQDLMDTIQTIPAMRSPVADSVDNRSDAMKGFYTRQMQLNLLQGVRLLQVKT